MSQLPEPIQIGAEEKQILTSLIKKGIFELKPTIDKDGVHYIEVEETLNIADPIYILNMLKELYKQGLLEAKVVDWVLMCPHCGSPEVHSKYACPKCDSHNVEYTELIEHIRCGYIGSMDKFIKGSSMVCPSCQTILTDESSKGDASRKQEKQIKATVHEGVKYLIIGSCFQCEKCGYRFDKPEIIHFCQKCRGTFTYQEAKYSRVLAYEIKGEIISSLRRDMPIIESIRDNLIKKGFQVQLHPLIRGSSGVQHSFDILAEKNETRLVIDISLTGSKNDMIALLGKKIDVKATRALIIDLSNSNELIPLQKVYDIAVLKKHIQ